METRESLIERMKEPHKRILELITCINKEAEIYPGWTTSELLAHLSGWDELVIEYLQEIIQGMVPVVIEGLDIDEYNLLSVKKRSGMHFDQILQEYTALRKKLLNLLAEVPFDQIEREHILPWGETGTLLDVVNVFGPHESGHADDLEEVIHKSEK